MCRSFFSELPGYVGFWVKTDFGDSFEKSVFDEEVFLEEKTFNPDFPRIFLWGKEGSCIILIIYQDH